MSAEDPSVWKYATEAVVGVVGALVAVVWRNNADAIAAIGAKLEKKADKHEINNAMLRDAAKHAEDQHRAEDQRKELQLGVERIYDALDEHRKDTQTRFDTIIEELHSNRVAMLHELAKKADR